jgi:hypothetical protein
MKWLLIFLGVLIAVGIVAAVPLYKTFKDLSFGNSFANVKHSKPPLTIAQVENLMGTPARIEHSETTGITGDVYHFLSPSGSDMKVVFVNGVVFLAEIIPGAKS